MKEVLSRAAQIIILVLLVASCSKVEGNIVFMVQLPLYL